jgi:hypothetical protein
MTLTNQHISRQLDLVPISILTTPVTIIGAGAVGSWVALTLAKMGFTNMQVFDDDTVDIVNMSSQFYGLDDITKPKVAALHDLVVGLTGTQIKAIPEKWTGMKLNGIVIMAVDSMATRKEIYEKHKLHMGCEWLIDARMGAETMLIYTVNPNSLEDQKHYEGTLYSDKEAVQEPCTAKSTTYCALVLSGLIAKTVRDVLVRAPYLRNATFSLKGNDFLAFPKKLS